METAENREALYGEYLAHLRAGNKVEGGSPYHGLMHQMSQEALQITAEINGSYHSPAELRTLMEKLTGVELDESFALFPPFYSECGKNIRIGKRVFINCCCHFQDQGGVEIGDDCLIGSFVVLATLNHGTDPEQRGDLLPGGIRLGKKVWVGSHATILPGVTVGDNAIIAAGAVVTKDVPANAVVAGVPARVVKLLDIG